MKVSRRGLAATLLAGTGALTLFACSGDEKSGLGMYDSFELHSDDAAVPLAAAACLNCHEGADWGTVPPTGGPILDGVAARLSLSWMRDFLHNPDAARGRCADLLHGLDSNDRTEATGDLLHWFASNSGRAPLDVNPGLWNPAAGESLFNKIGCFACHEDELGRRELSARWNLHGLADFLEDPYAQRPHDLMPNMSLTRREAEWIASYLLRNQEPRIQRSTTPGLKVSVYVFAQQPQSVTDLAGLTPVRETVSSEVSVVHRTQDERFGLVFDGLLEVGEGGERVIYTKSDDGSRLWLDGALVVDNDGNHAPQRRSAAVTLEPGLHALRIEMFEAGGGEELSAGWLVDGREQPFSAESLSHGSMTLPPTGWEDFVVDDARAERGRVRVQDCLTCHRPAGQPAQPTRGWIASEGGCLSESPPPAAPRFGFDDEQRAFLRAMVRGVLAGEKEYENPEMIAFQKDAELRGLMSYMQCAYCHPRAELGGPSPEALAHFTGGEDLGDEGVRPPDLTGIGAKLTSEELEKVLLGDSRVRPYLHTRMPIYAPQFVQEMPAMFAEVDAGMFGEAVAFEVDSEEAIEAGRLLAGIEGMACVSCHTVSGHRSPGIQGMDLAVMGGRLRPEWFREWVLDPPRMRSGTRMPAFFPGGVSVHTDVLGGDAEAQVAALWAYLSLGDGMPLPAGLLIDAAAYELVPVERPIYVGVFFEGLSARTTAVGFPERVNAAFDLHNARLGMLWAGDFLDVAGTWGGRAGELETPPVEWDRVRVLPHGPAFARLDTPDAKWPTATGKEAGWRMRSHRRDADGRPTWVYAQGDLVVEESLIPRFSADGAHLTRRFRVTNPGSKAATMRAWGQSYFEVQELGGWLAEGRLSLNVHGAEARVLSRMPPDHDLLVNIPAGVYGFEFEVEMSW